ncbi:MAG: YhfC family intramembrane metalloprotease [Anaerostipes sp.]|jgi:uncharacterized membrane protein YhfC
MLSHVSNQVVVLKLVAGVIGVLIPIITLAIWKKQTKSKIKPAVVGAIIFVVFSQILEGVPKVFLFMGDTVVSRYVLSHAWAYVLAGCLLASVFEEVGRYVGFRYFLKGYENKKNAITYGIGHGGIECILILGIGAVSLQVPWLVGYDVFHMFLEVFERILAMTLHIGLSVVVFRAVREKKIGWLFLAILIHGLFDVPAALYQFGVIGINATEIWLFIETMIVVFAARKIYVQMEG